ncbi:MAG: aspartate carbamoyltransferase [Candidatus Nealsonbacteria bacterium]
MKRLPHFIETQQLTVPWLEEDFYPLVDEMQALLEKREEGFISSPVRPELQGKNIVELFFGASTRTNLSFQFAAHELSATNFATDNASISLSVAKDETLRDTLQVISGYSTVDLIVLRTPIDGKEDLSIKNAVQFSSKPVISAGDRNLQHPTQTLVDLYTIRKKKGRLNDLTLGLGGDLGGSRTIKSLIYMAARYRMRLVLISPKGFRIPDDLRNWLDKHEIEYIETHDAKKEAHRIEVYYVVRTQKENANSTHRDTLGKYGPPAFYSANKELLDILPSDTPILHPLPRTRPTAEMLYGEIGTRKIKKAEAELPYETDDDPRATYFQQAKYGQSVRMALLITLLTEPYRTIFLEKTNPLTF